MGGSTQYISELKGQTFGDPETQELGMPPIRGGALKSGFCPWCIWGFPKITGTFGVPIIRITVFGLGSILGVPLFRETSTSLHLKYARFISLNPKPFITSRG